MVKRPNNAAPTGGKNKEGTGNTADFNSTIEVTSAYCRSQSSPHSNPVSQRTFEFDEAQQKYSHHSEPHAVKLKCLEECGRDFTQM